MGLVKVLIPADYLQIEQALLIRERGQRPFQHPVDKGYGDAVVGNWNIEALRIADARKHFLAVYHAPAAADDQGVLRYILIHQRPGIGLKNYILARVAAYPAGQL